MSKNDSRTALPDGSELRLSGKGGGDVVYRLKEIGRGGSCIVYKGIRKEPAPGITGERGFTQTQIIKEFYPLSVSGLWREGKRICVPPNQQESFNQHKEHFLNGSHLLAMFYEKEPAKTLPRPSPFLETEANGTVYLVSDPGAGVLMDEKIRAKLSLYQIAQIMDSLCAYTYEHFHQEKSLYLDFKPDNIFLGEVDGNHYIALFDFGTVIKKSDLKERAYKFISYSDGWAPREQKQWIVSQISERTDIYSIGAVFFWLLTGEKPTSDKQSGGFDSDLEIIERKKLNLRKISELCKDADNAVVDTINKIFIHTLRNSPDERYESVLEIQKALEPIFGEGFSEQNHGGSYLADLFRDLINPLLKKVDEGFIAVNENLVKVKTAVEDGFDALKKAHPGKPYLATAPVWTPSEQAIGREAEKEQLHAILKDYNIAFIQGMGGLGKSELAKMYADKYKGDYDIIKFITFTESLKNTIAEIPVQNLDETLNLPRESDDGGRLRTISAAETTVRMQRADALYPVKLGVLREQNERTLIVIDNYNINNDKSLKDLQGMNCRFLFTTRNEQQNSKTNTVALQELEPEQALQLFYRHCTTESCGDLSVKALLELIGFNTLVLILAAKAIERNDVPLESLVQAIKGCNLASVKGRVKHNIDYANGSERQVIGYLRIVFNLFSLEENEKVVMTIMGLIPPTGIPRKDFTAWSGCDIDDVNALIDRGWIQWKQGTKLLSLHPVIAELVMEDLNPGSEACCKRYLHALLEEMDKENSPEQSDYLCGFALRVATMVEDLSLDFAKFCYQTGNLLYRRTKFMNALAVFQKVLIIQETVLGKDHLDTSKTYSNIALVYNSLGEYLTALEWFGKALAIKEKVLGKDHTDTAKTYNNMAVVYRKLGEYQTALEWYNKVLEIQEKVLGKDHPDTASTYNNIAVVYYIFSEYQTALEWFGKDLAVREKVFGKNHPDTALAYNNIAGVYEGLGEYKKALKRYNQALAIREKVLGKNHPDTAVTYNNIAMVYDSLSEYEKALEWYNKALEIQERVLGKDHTDTALVYNNIAEVHCNLGEYQTTLEWLCKALAVYEGKDHSSTATIYNNMAMVYYKREEYQKALEWYGKALAIWEDVLGKDNRSTATTFNNIAMVYDRLGEYQSALEWYIKALDIYKRVFCIEHPDNAYIYDNIAGVYDCLGEHQTALEWYSKALIIHEIVFGKEHPDTKRICKHIAVLNEKISGTSEGK